MAGHGHGAAGGSAEADFEAVLARCIERFAEGGAEAAERVVGEHPALAERLRGRLRALERLGLLAPDRGERPASIGRYQILGVLGRGGMAVVYRARDPATGAIVALKAATMPLLGDRRARARFEREIRACAGLRHPNVVPILDAGEEHGRPFFTMEYVEGATLSEVIRDLRACGQRPDELGARDLLRPGEPEAAGEPGAPAGGRSYFEAVARVVLQVAQALDHVHAHGVLHRDVKPSNVLLRADGHALLFDLGLAHVEDQPALTRSGDFAGTAYYVSPEQVADGPKELDPRSDVYSLGVTLYELLTLRRPFEGRSTAQILRAIAGEDPRPPRRVNPRVPRDLEAICTMALEKEPARRYPSARALANDLRRFLDGQPVRARRLSAAQRLARFARRHPARALVALLAALLALGLPLGLALANRAIRAQRDLAALSAEESRRQVARNAQQIDFLVQLFDSSGAPGLLSQASSTSDALTHSAERVAAEFEDQPLVRAALMEAIGRVYAKLGLHERALQELDRAFALLHSELGEHHGDVARALSVLAGVHLEAGNPEAAEALARRALAALEGAPAADPALELAARLALADALAARGRLEGAREVLEAAPVAAAAEERAALLERLGRIAAESGEPEVALARFAEALALRGRALDPDLVAIAGTLEAEAAAAAEAGQDELAAADRERAAALRAAWAAPAPWSAALGGPADRQQLFRRFLLLPEWIADFDRTFQEGITALQAGRPGEALARFRRCGEWDPGRPVCAYNSACALALLGEPAAALAELERATALGFGCDEVGRAALEKDSDLGALRGDPRFRRVLERAEALRTRLALEQAEPAFRAPRRGPGPWPLLVLLHAHGSDERRALDGPWAEAADELGLALLAPAAPLAVGEDPALGKQWYEDPRELVLHPNRHGQRILDQIAACAAREPIDERRIVLAGEGQAAPLAFDLALRAPGRFRGVLLFDGTIQPEVAADRWRRAAALGLAVRVAFGPAPALAGPPAPDELARTARDVEGWLAERGLASAAACLDPSLAPGAQRARALAPLLVRDGGMPDREAPLAAGSPGSR